VRLFENRLLGVTFGSKSEEVKGGGRRLHKHMRSYVRTHTHTRMCA